eukprot:5997175-Prymnesium_polylepis.1
MQDAFETCCLLSDLRSVAALKQDAHVADRLPGLWQRLAVSQRQGRRRERNACCPSRERCAGRPVLRWRRQLHKGKGADQELQTPPGKQDNTILRRLLQHRSLSPGREPRLDALLSRSRDAKHSVAVPSQHEFCHEWLFAFATPAHQPQIRSSMPESQSRASTTLACFEAPLRSYWLAR